MPCCERCDRQAKPVAFRPPPSRGREKKRKPEPMSHIDHTSLSVSNSAAAKAFYAAALEPLGITVLMEFPKAVTGNVDVAGLGSNGKPFFWLADAGRTTPRVHLAFAAGS